MAAYHTEQTEWGEKQHNSKEEQLRRRKRGGSRVHSCVGRGQMGWERKHREASKKDEHRAARGEKHQQPRHPLRCNHAARVGRLLRSDYVARSTHNECWILSTHCTHVQADGLTDAGHTALRRLWRLLWRSSASSQQRSPAVSNAMGQKKGLWKSDNDDNGDRGCAPYSISILRVLDCGLLRCGWPNPECCYELNDRPLLVENERVTRCLSSRDFWKRLDSHRDEQRTLTQLPRPPRRAHRRCRSCVAHGCRHGLADCSVYPAQNP